MSEFAEEQKDRLAIKTDKEDPTTSPYQDGDKSAVEGLATEDISMKLLMRIDLHVLLMLCVVYTLAFLDRTNVGNALIYGMPEELQLHGIQTNTALAVFFVAYIMFEIPANIFMKKLKPHIFLSASMFLFGLVTILQGLVQNYAGFVTIRFILGIVDAGILPASLYLISMWYKKVESQKRFSFFYNASSLAAAFSGLLASAIGKMDGIGGYSAWRWIFILEGILTCMLSVAAFFFVADFPEDAKWLTEEERALIVKRLAADQGESGLNRRLTFLDVGHALSDPKLVLGVLMYFGPLMSAYGLVYFIPSIVTTYGYPPISAQLHSVVPWAAAFGFSMIIAFLSDRAGKRFPFIILCLCVALAGNLILYNISDNNNTEYAGVFLYLMGVIGAMPMVLCWFAMNLRGHCARAVGIPLQIGLSNVAGIIATFSFPSSDAPRYRLGYTLGLAFLCMASLVSLGYLVMCLVENRKRQKTDRLVL